jgi:hypothetical protein
MRAIWMQQYAYQENNYICTHAGISKIVGHNRMDEISEYQCEYGNVIFCDALWNEKYLKI